MNRSMGMRLVCRGLIGGSIIPDWDTSERAGSQQIELPHAEDGRRLPHVGAVQAPGYYQVRAAIAILDYDAHERSRKCLGEAPGRPSGWSDRICISAGEGTPLSGSTVLLPD